MNTLTPMTPEAAPEWLSELTPTEYAQRRNDEIISALHSLKIADGSWIRVAASMLHTAGALSPEFGSYHHSCLIVAGQLRDLEQNKWRDALVRISSGMVDIRPDRRFAEACLIATSALTGELA